MSVDKSSEYVPLLNYENDYEILNDFPFTIRRKCDGSLYVCMINNDGKRVCVYYSQFKKIIRFDVKIYIFRMN